MLDRFMSSFKWMLLVETELTVNMNSQSFLWSVMDMDQLEMVSFLLEVDQKHADNDKKHTTLMVTSRLPNPFSFQEHKTTSQAVDSLFFPYINNLCCPCRIYCVSFREWSQHISMNLFISDLIWFGCFFLFWMTQEPGQGS